ncbi:hypothetical protein TRVL_02707 [Trypanosoma vivax]|uniref:Uncharacterized protein n=1 Tax=Trypanosoma vivax (strain Y486) TaxID=1055687 RepID=G0TX34_TRYVY|nr:hypothetical protein TRVL_02707 [Trypanosoma vivax]CCC48524.1 conserved hypothetical protein [Trypanosoma vivax Y486]
MESSVTSLIDLLNSVETRRRVVMMKRKEAEMRLSFVTEEQQQLQEQSARNQVREAELKKELDHLLEEQRQIQLQLMMGTDAVRQSEIEETLLIGHMRDQLERVEGLLSQWHDHAQTLEDIQQAWNADGAAAPLQQRIVDLEAETANLHSSVEQLERDIQRKKQVRASLCAGITTITSPQAILTGEVAECVDTRIKEQLELKRNELLELRAQHSRQAAALDREVADMTSRSTELAQWLADTIGSRDQALASIRALYACVDSGVCAACGSRS